MTRADIVASTPRHAFANTRSVTPVASSAVAAARRAQRPDPLDAPAARSACRGTPTSPMDEQHTADEQEYRGEEAAFGRESGAS